MGSGCIGIIEKTEIVYVAGRLDDMCWALLFSPLTPHERLIILYEVHVQGSHEILYLLYLYNYHLIQLYFNRN